MNVSASDDLFSDPSSAFPYSLGSYRGGSFEILVSYRVNKLRDATLPTGGCQFPAPSRRGD